MTLGLGFSTRNINMCVCCLLVSVLGCVCVLRISGVLAIAHQRDIDRTCLVITDIGPVDKSQDIFKEA